ncbi:hypothetical protein CEUSTIGMA_g1431.t1 [Chlamydomonas eustigma]|uniref:Tubby C-terminal domain-containing protein n=1 Tax=Chlamydomonas eustigma TaxID=1157962 RepID=A0A250WT51_9CHLO|nr:hypothetical protein CEUSTIGMA_g1431.t1 [Chlamydomonas eustigma]|eukprot:GAX73981.1 hypothetical protein CEUSTIGMA_g1431.t1 [Chlamydomonas eustigma]
MALSASNIREGSLTPGEIEGKLAAHLYLSPSGKNQDYIPAGKGGLRNVHSAFSAEAQHLPDADLRLNSKFEKVWGNAAFESDSASSPPIAVTKPGSVKLNNLFDDPSSRVKHVDQHLSTGTRVGSRQMEESLTPTEARGPSIINFFRKGPAERTDEPAGTFVQAFDAEDDAGAQVAARPRAMPAANSRVQSAATWEVELKQMLSSNMREEAVHRVGPMGDLVRCYIKRVKGFFGSHCTFQMFLDNGEAFLLAARKRKKSKTSSYIISLDLEDLKRDTENCIAKLKANFVGTEYMLWGKTDDVNIKKGYAAEQLCINYKGSTLTQGGPRSMHVIVPMPETQWQPTAPDGSDSLSNSLELAKRRELAPHMERKISTLCSKPPEYDESIKGYTLDFHGRVKAPSVKNFQLVAWNHNSDKKGGDLLLQFGKIEEDLYALDFAYPMTVHSAFAIALASIDTKLCYTM